MQYRVMEQAVCQRANTRMTSGKPVQVDEWRLPPLETDGGRSPPVQGDAHHLLQGDVHYPLEGDVHHPTSKATPTTHSKATPTSGMDECGHRIHCKPTVVQLRLKQLHPRDDRKCKWRLARRNRQESMHRQEQARW